MSQVLILPDEMRQAEALSVDAGISLSQLMENAGRAVAAEIVSRYSKRPVTVLCGPGNNGGDGFVVARLLYDLGWDVSLHLMGNRTALKGAALVASNHWKRDVLSVEAPFTGALVVDALFGIGLSRDFPKGLAEKIAALRVPVVACDIPSGLDAVDGRPRGAAVQADLTVTFFKPKPAHVLGHAKMFVGEVVVAEIGIPPEAVKSQKYSTTVNAPSPLPEIAYDQHKYSRGGAYVWSGPALQTGASRLAAWAAQKVGAGAVAILGPGDALAVHAHHMSSIMLRETSLEKLMDLLHDKKFRAICLGPAAGVTEGTRRAALSAISSGLATVLDADALTVFEKSADILFQMIKQQPLVRVVLTPHEGEFAFLFTDLTDKPLNRVEQATAAARLSGAIIVLKGAGTVIAHPDGRVRIQTEAPAKLATAGSGDVLAGMVTGLMAQGLSAFEAASTAVWHHSAAAQRTPSRSIAAEEIIAHIAL